MINVKIAVTYDNGQIFQHFGHTEQFKLYTVEDGNIVEEKIIDTNGSGHGALAGFLKTQEVDTLICGGIGGGAKEALAASGITLYGGASGSADEAVSALLAGTLSYNSEATCNHHHDHEDKHAHHHHEDKHHDDKHHDDHHNNHHHEDEHHHSHHHKHHHDHHEDEHKHDHHSQGCDHKDCGHGGCGDH